VGAEICLRATAGLVVWLLGPAEKDIVGPSLIMFILLLDLENLLSSYLHLYTRDYVSIKILIVLLAKKNYA